MKKKIKVLIILFAVVIIAAMIAFHITKKNNSKEELKEIKPSYGSIKEVVSTTGTVKPQNRLEIKPAISGRIEKIMVKEGQRVRVGQVLALMSSTERAALLDAAKLKGGEETKYWEDVYKATPLVAPINGEVIVRAVEPGQTVTTSDAVLVLSDRLIVKADVDETDIGKLKIRQKAIISLDAYPEIKVNAVVDHISYESNIVNNVTIYEVDILPENTPSVFRSGMSANVEVIVKEKTNILLLPISGVLKKQENSYVLIKNPSTQKILKKLL